MNIKTRNKNFKCSNANQFITNKFFIKWEFLLANKISQTLNPKSLTQSFINSASDPVKAQAWKAGRLGYRRDSQRSFSGFYLFNNFA